MSGHMFVGERYECQMLHLVWAGARQVYRKLRPMCVGQERKFHQAGHIGAYMSWAKGADQKTFPVWVGKYREFEQLCHMSVHVGEEKEEVSETTRPAGVVSHIVSATMYYLVYCISTKLGVALRNVPKQAWRSKICGTSSTSSSP